MSKNEVNHYQGVIRMKINICKHWQVLSAHQKEAVLIPNPVIRDLFSRSTSAVGKFKLFKAFFFY